MRNQCDCHSGVNARQSEAVACMAVFLEISHKIAELRLRLFVNAPTTSAHSWASFARMGDDHHCHRDPYCPQKGISLLPDHHVLSASRRTNSEPRLTVFHPTFASAYTANLRYEPCCFVCLCFGLFVCCCVLWCCALLWCLARISLVSIFNSIKVTCAFRHTQRLHPCKKKILCNNSCNWTDFG